MNKLRPILLALTAVAALSFAYPAKANLITNPGFETGDFTGWSLVANGGGIGSVEGTIINVAPHSGNFQAFITPNGLSMDLSQTVATTAGATYTINFFAAGTQFNTFAVNWNGSTIFSHLFASNSGYTEYTFDVTATGSSALLDFHVSQIGGFFLDDVSVEPAGVGVPDGGTTVMLLGAALGALGMARRFLKA